MDDGFQIDLLGVWDEEVGMEVKEEMASGEYGKRRWDCSRYAFVIEKIRCLFGFNDVDFLL